MAQFSTLLIFLVQCGALAVQLLVLESASSVAAASSSGKVIDIIVIGDSTAANFTNEPSRYPLCGWAMFLQDQFSSNMVAVRDLAVGGRSSKSYYDEKLWQKVKSTYLSAGDYVFIQFGHNDQKTDSSLHTDPFTTYKQYLSVYINDTRAARATPVLLTSISRAVWEANGAFKHTLGDYPVAMRQLAEELQVPLIDLNRKTAALFTKLGQATTQNTLFMCLPASKYSNYPQGINDTTNLQVKGAKKVAALAAEGIVKANLPIQAYLHDHIAN